MKLLLTKGESHTNERLGLKCLTRKFLTRVNCSILRSAFKKLSALSDSTPQQFSFSTKYAVMVLNVTK